MKYNLSKECADFIKKYEVNLKRDLAESRLNELERGEYERLSMELQLIIGYYNTLVDEYNSLDDVNIELENQMDNASSETAKKVAHQKIQENNRKMKDISDKMDDLDALSDSLSWMLSGYNSFVKDTYRNQISNIR